ncbi:MAG: TonB-dependent receptor [Robiginitomaculum sp.]
MASLVPGTALAQAISQDPALMVTADDEIVVQGIKNESSAVTLLGPVENIPQVINIISAKTLAVQGVDTLEQALRNVPGVTTDLGEGGVLNGDQFFIRGLSAKNDLFTDGLRDFGVFVRDSFNYEQVEVLKGSSATTLGRGVTGGGINTTSKTPMSEDVMGVTLAAGSAHYLRGTADWNKTINDTTAIRLNVMVHNNGVVGRDVIKSKRWGFAPSIGFGLGTDTTFTLAFLHQSDDRIPDYGVGFFNNRPLTEFGIPTSNFYGYDTDTDESTVDTLTARLKHQFNENIRFTSDTKVGAYNRFFMQTINSCRTGGDCTGIDNPATAAIAEILTRSSPYNQDTWGVQNISTMLVTAPLGNMKNEFLIGIDASYQSNERQRIGYDDLTRGRRPKNVLNPTHGSGLTLGQTYRLEHTTAKDLSIFVSDQLWFTKHISTVLGGRINSYEVDQNRTDYVTPYTLGFRTVPCGGVASANCLTRYRSNTSFFNPKASLLWKPNEQQNYYISFATSSTPPGVTVANGTSLSSTNQDLEPEKNKTYEVGAKIGFFDGAMLLQTSLFKTEKDNAKETDPATGSLTASGLKQDVKGFEIGVQGNVTKNLFVNANYTYINSTIGESIGRRSGTIDTSVTGNKTQYVPENAASIFATYDFAGGALDGLQIGGGANYQSKVFLNTSNTQSLQGYVTMNAFAGYDFEKFRVAVNVKNLANKNYFSQIHSSRVAPAAGRTFIVTVSSKF